MNTKTTSVILLALILSLFGCVTNQTQYHKFLRTEGNLDIVLPRLSVHKLTLEEAVVKLREEWLRQIDGDELPWIIITDYTVRNIDGSPMDGYPDHRKTISFEAKNITVRDALRLLSNYSAHRLRLKSKVVELEHVPWIDEDWVTVNIPVSEVSKKYFDLDKTSAPTELIDKLNSLGVTFPEGMTLEWDAENSLLRVTNYPQHIYALKELLRLLDNGYTISRKPF